MHLVNKVAFHHLGVVLRRDSGGQGGPLEAPCLHWFRWVFSTFLDWQLLLASTMISAFTFWLVGEMGKQENQKTTRHSFSFFQAVGSERLMRIFVIGSRSLVEAYCAFFPRILLSFFLWNHSLYRSIVRGIIRWFSLFLLFLS